MATRGKIGVLTFHKCINYGSYWQARCLVEGLRARGYDAELLDHDCRVAAIAELRCAFQPGLPERTARGDLRSYAAKTRRFFEAFSALPLSHPFSLHQPQALEGYDTIIVGSDEVWNLRHPWYGGKPIFYGAGFKVRRLVSYAASFGSHDAADGLSSPWTDHLSNFSALSVRDDNSRTLVRSALGREPEVVLDPCLQFAEFARPAPHNAAQPYALIYGHGFPAWLRGAARRWSEAVGIKLVSVGYKNDWADEQRITASPHEFAELMAGARAVITNFFHGCVFALLNAKPFAAAPTSYRFNKVRDLAAAVGAENRLVNEGTSAELLRDLLGTRPEPHVAHRIAACRHRSSSFLDAALA
jgi:hypothetical protein